MSITWRMRRTTVQEDFEHV